MSAAFTVKSALSTVRAYQDATPDATLRFARALTFLSVTDPKQYTVRGLVTVAADLARPVGRNRIALLIRAVKESPDDVTGEAFMLTVKALTDANRGERTPTAPVTADEGDTVTADKPAASSPQGDATPTVTVATMTPADAIRLLWEIVEHHGDDDTVRDAIAEAYSFTQPVNVGHLVATVAA